MKKISINLRGKLLLVLAFGLFVSFGVIGAARIWQAKITFLDEITRSGQGRADVIADSVANMIVAYDYSNMELVAERIAKQQDVQQLTILNSSGKIMVKRSRPGWVDGQGDDISASGSMIFVAPAVFSGSAVGSVVFNVSTERFEQAINTTYRNVIGALSLTALFLGALIYTAVSSLIVKPLLRLSEAASQFGIGDYAAELPEVSGDEMGNLVCAFYLMRESRKANDARMGAIFEHSPDAFIQLDYNGNIIDWNGKAEVILGYTKCDVLGKNFSLVMPPVDLGLNVGYQKCYQKSANIIGVIREVVGQRKDGSLFPLELRTSEIYFEQEHAYLVLARDISARKENEARLMRAMNEAEAANAAKSAFLSNMSHEIRTPMNSVIGMTHLALKTHLSARQHDYLAKIEYSAKHLLNIVNDILDFSKIEAHKLELDLLDFELGSVFENLSNQLAHSALMKGVSLKFDLDARLSRPVHGDPLRLSQVLLNYTSNAIKFTDKGEITVLAWVLEDSANDLLIRFEVRDSGIGLRQDEIAHLFQPFHQADASTTRKYGGTGLGLAICKELVGLMGGSVGVESQPGLGSTFWFEVRLPKADKVEVKSHMTSLDPDLLKQAAVLLVEDNLFNQQVAVEMLREVGASVSIANNGQEAIEMLLARHFDCVLMDVQMPVMDGMEATRHIRANPALARTRIIAMTANAGREDRERCYAAGMDSFIAKPIFSEQLYAVIAECLVAAQPHAESAGQKPGAGDTASVRPPVSHAAADAPDNKRQDSVIDLSVLSKMMGADTVKVRKFALKFIQSARQGLDEIAGALKRENWAELAALGHRNKSPARTVGAQGFADLCQRLEGFKHGGDAQRARDVVAQMEALLRQIEEQINDEVS